MDQPGAQGRAGAPLDDGHTAGRPPPAAPARAARIVGEPVAAHAPETRRLYAADWARFAAWCGRSGVAALPASPATLAAYLLEAATEQKIGRAGLARRRAAVVAMHRLDRQPIPVLDDVAFAAIRAAARPRVPRRERSSPELTSARLVTFAAGCPRDRAGLRDRALLLLAAATAPPPRRAGRRPEPADDPEDVRPAPVPRSFWLGLDAEDIRFTATGAVLTLSQADRDAPDLVVTLARSAAASCPVRALEDWLRASDTAFGPVFRKVDRWGNVEHARLGPGAWTRILARRGGRQIVRAPSGGKVPGRSPRRTAGPAG